MNLDSSQTAFVFPGQGSQGPGMAKDLFEIFASVRDLFEKANSILEFDLSEICFHGPEEILKETQYTQPALYVHSAAVAELLQKNQIGASAAAGHSLGEFSALAYAGVYGFEDGLRLVQKRAELMQKATAQNPGAMAAIIGLESRELTALCTKASRTGLVQPANFNSPGQIVISGTREGVDQAIQLAKEKGAKRAVTLPVSGGFHSPLMKPAAESIREVLEGIAFSESRIPVWANVTAEPAQDPAEIQENLVKQLTHSVRWIETIEKMIASGVSRFVEVGPGKVLSGLIKRINRTVEVIPCGTAEELAKLSAQA